MRAFYFAWFCFFVISCGHDQRLADNPNQSILDGNWLSDCQSDQSDQGRKLVLTLSHGERLQWQELNFTDQSCQSLAFKLVYKGEYRLRVLARDYRYDLEFFGSDVQLEPLSSRWLDEANARAYCAQSTWQIGQAVTISQVSENCPISFSGEFFNRNLAQLDDQRLSLAIGLESDNIKPAEDSLDSAQWILTRQ